MFFSRPIQWYHSHADPIWLDGTFNLSINTFIFVFSFAYGSMQSLSIISMFLTNKQMYWTKAQLTIENVQ